MFESDDFDQALSQYDLAEFCKENISTKESKQSNEQTKCHSRISTPIDSKTFTNNKGSLSGKDTKREMINALFDHRSKRKFPGPAGLLTGSLEDKREDICQIELLSQDVDLSQNNLCDEIFQSPTWVRLLQDVNKWGFGEIDSLNVIKQQALAGNLLKRKANTITAFIEAVDRTATDPLVVLRDFSGSMKCTLHRDAWLAFSSYIYSGYCAIVLWKPTVLTTGSTYKKHYLNITLSNIVALYSTTKDMDLDTKPLPEGYMKILADDFTAIKLVVLPSQKSQDIILNVQPINTANRNIMEDYFDDLDSDSFLEEVF